MMSRRKPRERCARHGQQRRRRFKLSKGTHWHAQSGQALIPAIAQSRVLGDALQCLPVYARRIHAGLSGVQCAPKEKSKARPVNQQLPDPPALSPFSVGPVCRKTHLVGQGVPRLLSLQEERNGGGHLYFIFFLFFFLLQSQLFSPSFLLLLLPKTLLLLHSPVLNFASWFLSDACLCTLIPVLAFLSLTKPPILRR